MNELRTEDEQIDAIRQFFAKEGKNIVLAIVVAIAAIFGFQGWQQSQQTAKEAASLYYSDLSGKVTIGQKLSEEDRAAFDKTFAKLLEEYPDSVYASYATLLKAKLEVDGNDLNAAGSSLQWVIDAKANDDLVALAALRKAQVLLALDKLDEALLLLSGNSGPFVSEFAELKGDVLLQQGNNEQALEAYKAAKEAKSSDAKTAFTSPVLSIKIESLEGGDKSKLFAISAVESDSTENESSSEEAKEQE